jgi:hypothetical protein
VTPCSKTVLAPMSEAAVAPLTTRIETFTARLRPRAFDARGRTPTRRYSLPSYLNETFTFAR